MKLIGLIDIKTNDTVQNATDGAVNLIRHAVNDYKATRLMKRAWHSPALAEERDFHTVHITDVCISTSPAGYIEYHGDALHGDAKTHYVWLMVEKVNPQSN